MASENTLCAFRLALEQGADGVELDVRRCKSGELVVAHDADFRRGAGDARAVAELSLREIARIELPGGEHPPRLRDAIALVLPSAALLNIEVKSDVPEPQRTLEALLAELSAVPTARREQLLLSSFDRTMARWLREHAPDLAVALLVRSSALRDSGRALVDSGALQGLSGVHPQSEGLDARAMERFHAAGLFVNAWTVNDPERALCLAREGVDGLITDDLPALVAALRPCAGRPGA